jgi:hypothetical protein
MRNLDRQRLAVLQPLDLENDPEPTSTDRFSQSQAQRSQRGFAR